MSEMKSPSIKSLHSVRSALGWLAGGLLAVGAGAAAARLFTKPGRQPDSRFL